MNKKNLIKGYVFFNIVILGVIYIILNCNVEKYNGMVFITFFINFILIIMQLIKSNKVGYSLDDMIWIFMLSFMVIAPILQYVQRSFPWGNSEMITDYVVVKTNITILIFSLTYIGFKMICKFNQQKKSINKLIFHNVNVILNLSFYLSFLCAFYIIYKVGITNLFSRSTNSLGIANGSIAMIIDTSFRAFPIITFSIHYVYKEVKKKYYSKSKIIVLFLIGVLINFPTGLPRFQMAAIYIGMLIILRRVFKNKYTFKYILLFGLLFIFPLINIFRNNSLVDIINLNIVLPNPSEDFLKGDFDTYSMLARAIIYTTSYGITWGRQLLGNVLFFLPRSFWGDKPVGSGVTIAEKLGWSFTNVSCPYIGEGIINFGMFGVVIFSIVLAMVVSKLNRDYQSNIFDESEEISIIRVIYPFIMGFLFFIMRGDLLSSLSFTLGFCVPCFILLAIDKVIIITKNISIR